MRKRYTQTGSAVYVQSDKQSDVQREFEVEYSVEPGEPMVWRTPNGDGYPGSPASCEILSARCVGVGSETEYATAKPNKYSTRLLSAEESAELGAAFMREVEADDELRQEVERVCFEEAGDGYDDDRW